MTMICGLDLMEVVVHVIVCNGLSHRFVLPNHSERISYC